ncbi:MAG: endonuclease [Gemmatimonadetes bacterium]|nr:endonuclease [Gemmatimonadota bacterium]
MTRPVTLFTGQWAELPLETVAQKAKGFGFDGLELACWGDHFDGSALSDYCQGRRDILAEHVVWRLPQNRDYRLLPHHR